MECSCNISCDFNGDWVDFDEEWEVAGKSLKCTECGSIIKKGEEYLHTTGVWVSDYSAWKQNHKTCKICEGIKKDMAGCVSYSALWYELHCCLGISYPEDYEKRPESCKELSEEKYQKMVDKLYL